MAQIKPKALAQIKPKYPANNINPLIT